ncbi:unnamed protein product, partial [Ectocarpus fasciculatus]
GHPTASHASSSSSPAAAAVVSMGVASDGNPFGVPAGLFCSFPVLCRGDGEWSFAEGFLLKEEAGHQLSLSVKELQEEKNVVVEALGEGPSGPSPGSSISPSRGGAAAKGCSNGGTPISSL